MSFVTDQPPRLAGVELGGTKCIAVVADGRDILARRHWPTGDDAPATLAAIADWLDHAHAEHGFDALGIASFGPLSLDRAHPDFGTILNTPKPGWAGATVTATLAGGRGVPVGFDTDVAGAALAEGLWGASVGCPVHVYLTIGTGIGGGVVIDGKPFHGAVHPEIGHVRVRRAPGDAFAGVCPVHGDCLEGLASGPAIARRAGCAVEALAADDPLWEVIASDIAELMQMLILTLSPQRIVIGGGVGHGQSHLVSRIRRATVERLCDYLPGQTLADLDRIIVPPGLGADAGVFGALALAASV